MTLIGLGLLLGACAAAPDSRHPTLPGTPVDRDGTEIIVAGQLFRTGTPVVLWLDPGGYDAYRPHRFFEPDQVLPSRPAPGCDTPNRLSSSGRTPRSEGLAATVDRDGWTLENVRQQVDQFVIHYDVTWCSRQCFKVLHDVRGLSVHFLLDLDGTIYQTCDLKERARHAGRANDRSVGIEIAHIGPHTGRPEVAERYRTDGGGVYLDLPASLGPNPLRTPGFVPRPARPVPITGRIQGQQLEQWDFTEAQYQALIRLTATLHRVLPGIQLAVPRAGDGSVRPALLPPAEQEAWSGLLGHWHVSERKMDPGPAFNWERVINGAQESLAPQ